ncbi:MAG TPA: hypothetical protein VJN18_24885 [Polyangiaceae bacterium]|nr:hypothetical protein [Polyangiaceae bacterium]
MRPLKLGIAFASWTLALCAAACGDPEEEKPGGSGASSTGATGNTGNKSSGGKSTGEGGADNTGNEATGGGDPVSMAGGEPVGDECAAAWQGEVPAPTVECDLDNLTDSGETLSGDITQDMTLSSGMIYGLSGPTRVMPGVTLTIEPCVKIVGDAPTAVLVVMAGDYAGAAGGMPGVGAKIEAVGEPDAPIIFTSAAAPGDRLPGDWGGLMILGNAISNGASRTADVVTRPTIEGLTAATPYGWDTEDFNDESSGSLAYVRIEYVSREISANEETNGLTFGSVGSGTTVHHVMVSNSNDDCFEWFGGAVNASHLVAYNCDDDMFDTDRGYSGKVQFAFGRQIEGTLETDSNGFEMDNGQGPISRPRTLAEWSNVTLCGTKEEGAAGGNAPRVGMAFRSGVGGAITNTLVTGFDNGGMFVTVDVEDLITVTNSTVFDNGAIYNTAAHTLGTTWFQDQEGNSIDAPDGLCDCFADPPAPFPTATIEGVAPAGFDDAAAGYQGAFPDAKPENNWMLGKWVDWSNE